MDNLMSPGKVTKGRKRARFGEPLWVEKVVAWLLFSVEWNLAKYDINSKSIILKRFKYEKLKLIKSIIWKRRDLLETIIHRENGSTLRMIPLKIMNPSNSKGTTQGYQRFPYESWEFGTMTQVKLLGWFAFLPGLPSHPLKVSMKPIAKISHFPSDLTVGKKRVIFNKPPYLSERSEGV